MAAFFNWDQPINQLNLLLTYDEGKKHNWTVQKFWNCLENERCCMLLPASNDFALEYQNGNSSDKREVSKNRKWPAFATYHNLVLKSLWGIIKKYLPLELHIIPYFISR